MELDEPVSTHFTVRELACPCCGERGYRSELVTFLERIRGAFGRPIPIVSGYRCARHNREIGATQTHATGLAVDLAIRGMEAAELEAIAIFHGATGRGLGHDHVLRHLDIVPTGTPAIPRPMFWIYPRSGGVE
jgi:zinc D-Ala-D-Ala carboxypeptidase